MSFEKISINGINTLRMLKRTKTRCDYSDQQGKWRKRKTPNAEPSSEITVVFPKNDNHWKDDHNKMLKEDIL